MCKYKYLYVQSGEKAKEITKEVALGLLPDWQVEAMEELAERDGYCLEGAVIVMKEK